MAACTVEQHSAGQEGKTPPLRTKIFGLIDFNSLHSRLLLCVNQSKFQHPSPVNPPPPGF